MAASHGPLTLVFDLGTTYLKAAVFDRDNALVGLSRQAVASHQPQAGHRQWPLDVFLRQLDQAVAELAGQRAIDPAHIDRVSFSTQANTFVLLDEDAAPLTELILWNDTRAAPQDVLRWPADPDPHRRTGVPAPHPQSMPSKLRWFSRNSPALWRRTRRVALLSDYLTWHLTGQWLTEAGMAALTGLLDIHTLQWWPEALALNGIDPALLAKPVRAGTLAGPVLETMRQRWSLAPSCQMVIGTLDQYAGAIGAGNREPGAISETTGTVLASVCCTRDLQPQIDPGIYIGPAHAPGLYYLMVFSETSANLLEHYQRQLPDRPDFATLDALAADADPGDLVIEPLDHGAGIEACFAHVRHDHTRGMVVRAILERVADELAGQVDLLTAGARPARILAAGGGARSALWLDIKAQRLGVAVQATACPEPTCLGAAWLAHLH